MIRTLLPRSTIGTAVRAALIAAACMLSVPGCAGPKDAGTIDLSASKKVAAEKGVGGPGERGAAARGGRAASE